MRMPPEFSGTANEFRANIAFGFNRERKRGDVESSRGARRKISPLARQSLSGFRGCTCAAGPLEKFAPFGGPFSRCSSSQSLIRLRNSIVTAN